jgi:hypothetical protein
MYIFEILAEPPTDLHSRPTRNKSLRRPDPQRSKNFPRLLCPTIRERPRPANPHSHQKRNKRNKRNPKTAVLPTSRQHRRSETKRPEDR